MTNTMEEVHNFLTIDADISLHFSRFNYLSFSVNMVNVKIIFRTIDPDKEILLAYNGKCFLTHQFKLCFGCSKKHLIETVLLSTHNICFG